MTIVVLTDCPPRLRGDLTKWMLEINTGVYVGNMSARVRDEIWERICEHVRTGRATMIYRVNNEQHMSFRVHNTTWQPVDFDGLTLMRKPLPAQHFGVPEKTVLPDGFSNAAHREKARKMARKSAPFLLCDYVVVDLETTGLHPTEDEIVELAAIRVTKGEVSSQFHQMIRIDKPLPKTVSQLTGITDRDILEQGVQLSKVMPHFLDFVREMPIVSHNAGFDQQFLQNACRRAALPPMKNRFVDTLGLARQKVECVSNYKLKTLADYFGIEQEGEHRALVDCFTTHNVFCKLKQM